LEHRLVLQGKGHGEGLEPSDEEFAAGPGAAAFDEAEVALGDADAHRQFELAPAFGFAGLL